MKAPPEYDPRYLAGIGCFNRRDYFEAHEVWENLWKECQPAVRKWVQGLIHAAVALYHAHRGNYLGARRLYGSGRRYMEMYPVPMWGLDARRFWQEMERTLAPLLRDPPTLPETIALENPPIIELCPAPLAWPDPTPWLREDSDLS